MEGRENDTRTIDRSHAPDAYLVVVDHDTAWRFALGQGETIIGRAEDARLRVRHSSVSRRHARIVRAGDAVTLHDLASHNGVTLNGVRIEAPRELASGDVLGVGEVTLVYHGPRAAMSLASAPSAAPGSPPFTERALGAERVYVADAAMRRIYELLGRLARADMPVLLHGETGTGKELAALQLHHASDRKGALVTINCAALPESLVESELFGYQKGAFSGAITAKVGLVEAAEGGTLFLDEIGDMPLGVQAKLLRVIETRRVLRLGDLRERSIDVRFVAATHRDLEAEASAGRFRQDLYFRLCGASVWLPPLRERREELILLAEKFLADARARARVAPATLTPAAWEVLTAHAWPGNVRELKQVIEYASAAAPGVRIETEHLPDRLWRRGPSAIPSAPPPPGASPSSLEGEVRALERERMRSALVAHGGNQSKAAEAIGMPRRTFVTKVKLYGLGRPKASDG